MKKKGASIFALCLLLLHIVLCLLLIFALEFFLTWNTLMWNLGSGTVVDPTVYMAACYCVSPHLYCMFSRLTCNFSIRWLYKIAARRKKESVYSETGCFWPAQQPVVGKHKTTGSPNKYNPVVLGTSNNRISEPQIKIWWSK